MINQPKILTHDEEIRILNYLINKQPLDNGSSRMIFDISNELAEELKIPENYIIKLATGLGGFRQNQLEIKTFLEYGDSGYFADIFAYGRYIEIMEKIEPEDWRDEAEAGGIDVDCWLEDHVFQRDGESDEDYNKRLQEEERNLNKINNAIEYLNDVLGTTSDNGQLGLTQFGDYVAYDYGFTTERATDDQISGMMDNIENDIDRRNDYLKDLKNLLSAEEDFLDRYERIFIRGGEEYEHYEFVGLVKVKEDQTWMAECYPDGYYKCDEYSSSYEGIKEAAINDYQLSAYKIYRRKYDIYDDLIEEELLLSFIPAELLDLWNKLIDKPKE